MSTPPPPPPPPPPGWGNQPPQGQPPGYGQPAPYPGVPGYGPPPAGGYGYQATPRTSGKATAAMVLGIVSLALGFATCGFGLLVGPVALILGRVAVKEIDRSGGTLGGRSQATTGWICGLIATILLALGLVLVVIAIATDDGSNLDAIFLR